MTDEDEIRQLIHDYTRAATRADVGELERLCTSAMTRQFSLLARMSIKLAGVLMPGRMRKVQVANLEIESIDDHKAIISYSTTFGKRRCYERVVLLKQDGRWKVDGKYV